jgi:hypothetical protein
LTHRNQSSRPFPNRAPSGLPSSGSHRDQNGARRTRMAQQHFPANQEIELLLSLALYLESAP